MNDYIIASVFGVVMVVAVKKYRDHLKAKPETFTPEKIEQICKKAMSGEL